MSSLSLSLVTSIPGYREPSTVRTAVHLSLQKHWLLEKDCSKASPQDASLGSWELLWSPSDSPLFSRQELAYLTLPPRPTYTFAMVEGKRVLDCVRGQQDKQSAKSLACMLGDRWGRVSRGQSIPCTAHEPPGRWVGCGSNFGEPLIGQGS